MTRDSNRVMRFLLIFSGIVFMLRGVKACITTIGNLVSGHLGSAYAVGAITAEALVALGLLTTGIAFIMLARSMHHDSSNGGAQA